MRSRTLGKPAAPLPKGRLRVPRCAYLESSRLWEKNVWMLRSSNASKIGARTDVVKSSARPTTAPASPRSSQRPPRDSSCQIPRSLPTTPQRYTAQPIKPPLAAAAAAQRSRMQCASAQCSIEPRANSPDLSDACTAWRTLQNAMFLQHPDNVEACMCD